MVHAFGMHDPTDGEMKKMEDDTKERRSVWWEMHREAIFPEKIGSLRERIIKIAGSLGPPSATRLARRPKEGSRSDGDGPPSESFALTCLVEAVLPAPFLRSIHQMILVNN